MKAPQQVEYNTAEGFSTMEEIVDIHPPVMIYFGMKRVGQTHYLCILTWKKQRVMSHNELKNKEKHVR